MRKGIIILFVSLIFSGICRAQFDPKATEAKIKVVYLYNFTKYIQWPSEYRSGDFIIGVLNGNTQMLSELNRMAASRTAGAQKFSIKNYKTVAEISKCNLLFLPESSNNLLSDVLKKVKGFSTLLVTESVGDAKKGASINFVFQDNKQEFELNKANAEKCHLVVSSSLSALARID